MASSTLDHLGRIEQAFAQSKPDFLRAKGAGCIQALIGTCSRSSYDRS